ncbi:FAL1, partial [Symbiodinium sp. CCMP2456]
MAEHSMPVNLVTAPGPFRQSRGWMAPVAAPVFPEHTPSPHRVIPPPPGLEIPEVPEAVAANLRFGVGSFGHPDFCTRPCVHISKGGVCPSGTACAYCHFRHCPIQKPDLQLRHRLLDANDQELLATFLPFIFKKAATQGLAPLVGRLLKLLQAEMNETQSEPIALGRFRPMRMSFMHLVLSSMRRLPPHIRAEVNRIKSELPPPAV